MLDTLQSTQVAALNRRTVPILGACLELGAGTRGTLMGPMALRTAGIARVLADLGHQVSDRGTLWEAESVAVEVAPAAAERCRHLAEIAGWTRRLHDHAYGMAAGDAVPVFLGGDHSISMGTISGVARRCREQGRELVVLWLDAHADYNTPETTPSGNMHGMALSFLAGEESLAPILASRPFHPVPPSNIHVFGARSIDPEEKVRLRAHGVDTVDMRQIDERGVSALLAERIEGWRAARRAPARELRRRLPRPGGGAGLGHGGAGRRDLPRGAPGHGDALRLRAWSARSTWSSSTPSSTSAAAPPSPPPSWWRASSAAPCSTASPAPWRPPDMPGETDMLDSAGLIDLETRLGAANYKPLDVVLTEGKGAWVTDLEGHRYLDCLAAYSAVNQGHCHPKILAAMVEQAQRLTLTSRAFRNDQLGRFYEEVAALTRSHKVLPMNSGAEAVETAIKAVRKWGYEVKGVAENQAEIIVCADNFHGRTLGVVSFSTDPDARGNFGPFVPGFVTVPFGDAEALEAAITPNTVGVPGRADPGRGGGDHPARRVFPAGAGDLHPRRGSR